VPIIPGLKPLATQKQLNLIPHRFHVDLPEALIKEVLKAKTKEAIRQVGIDWCIAQSMELIAAGVPFLHYYSIGKSGRTFLAWRMHPRRRKWDHYA
jgi:methylenetetrahydrofolate reductase (NADPH)